MAPTPFSRDILPSLDTLLHRALTPTKSLLSPALIQRQTAPGATVTVIAGDPNNNGPASSDDLDQARTLSGGAIAGIVIGSIAGLLLLFWIIRSCSNLGAPPGAAPNPGGRAWYDGVRDEYPPHHRHSSRSRSRHSRRSHRAHSRHHSTSGHRGHRRSVSEVREVRPVAVVRDRSPRGYI
ncbi:hypothetical protein B0T25DRAFT_248613 [Lasiosphaeria hispida]|uniref:Uncharacterized protein n=1 Tax=Lasiosphaeria hispida TaxID=260671 RepID=A0AAJ0HF64_9PEZI|nr:hypothetical protein B0T25DRAFT_248613 [Lasiosphaeria hispida]